MATTTDRASLAHERHISITTFKRDGRPVSTPVWCAADDGALLVFSEANSGKVKRIRRDPRVRIAACSARGRIRGPAVEGDAVVVDDATRVQELLRAKYGWMWPAYHLLMATVRGVRRQPAPEGVTIRISLR